MPYNKIKIFVLLLLLNECTSIVIVIKSYGISIYLTGPIGFIFCQKRYLSGIYYKAIYMRWKQYHWMQFRMVIIIVYVYVILNKSSEGKFEKYLETYRNQLKKFATYIVSSEIFVTEGTGNLHSLFLILFFLHMNFTIASLITNCKR